MTGVKNPSLIIGLSIPVLMTLFVAGSIYIPGLFISPETDFAYISGQNDRWNCRENFDVTGGKIRKVDNPQYQAMNGETDCTPPDFYIYETKTGSSRSVTFEELQKFTLDDSRMSPDGFEVVRGGGGGDFLFFNSRNYNSVYLRGRNVSRRIELKGEANSSYYYYDFQFLGWILPSS